MAPGSDTQLTWAVISAGVTLEIVGVTGATAGGCSRSTRKTVEPPMYAPDIVAEAVGAPVPPAVTWADTTVMPTSDPVAVTAVLRTVSGPRVAPAWESACPLNVPLSSKPMQATSQSPGWVVIAPPVIVADAPRVGELSSVVTAATTTGPVVPRQPRIVPTDEFPAEIPTAWVPLCPPPGRVKADTFGKLLPPAAWAMLAWVVHPGTLASIVAASAAHRLVVTKRVRRSSAWLVG